jgi:hypothetical protein
LWVMYPNHCQIMTLRKKVVTIICLWSQAPIEMRIVRKVVNIPLFVKCWEGIRNNIWCCWVEKIKIYWSFFYNIDS